MTEKQSINGKEVWFKVEPYHVQRNNPNIIPTEYFTVSYTLNNREDNPGYKTIITENNEPRLFESPVAALSFAAKKLEKEML